MWLLSLLHHPRGQGSGYYHYYIILGERCGSYHYYIILGERGVATIIITSFTLIILGVRGVATIIITSSKGREEWLCTLLHHHRDQGSGSYHYYICDHHITATQSYMVLPSQVRYISNQSVTRGYSASIAHCPLPVASCVSTNKNDLQ